MLREGIKLIGSGYDFWTDILREINRKFVLYENDLKFAKRLLRVRMVMGQIAQISEDDGTDDDGDRVNEQSDVGGFEK